MIAGITSPRGQGGGIPNQLHLQRSPKMVDRMERWIVEPDTYALHWNHNGTPSKLISQSDSDLRRLESSQLFARMAVRALASRR